MSPSKDKAKLEDPVEKLREETGEAAQHIAEVLEDAPTPQSDFVPNPADMTGTLDTRNGGGGDHLHKVSPLFEKPPVDLYADTAQAFTDVPIVDTYVIPGGDSYTGAMVGDRPNVTTDQDRTFETRSEHAVAQFDPLDYMPGGRDAAREAEAVATGKAVQVASGEPLDSEDPASRAEAGQPPVERLGFDPGDFAANDLVAEINRGEYDSEQMYLLRQIENDGKARKTVLDALERAIEEDVVTPVGEDQKDDLLNPDTLEGDPGTKGVPENEGVIGAVPSPDPVPHLQ